MSVDAHPGFRVVRSGRHAASHPACGTDVTPRVRCVHLSSPTSHTFFGSRAASSAAAERPACRHTPPISGPVSSPVDGAASTTPRRVSDRLFTMGGAL